MAFVPRVHNRAVPVSNRHVHHRDKRDQQEKHLRSLDQMKPRIDNKWGSMYNGVKEQKQASYAHVSSNRKRAQLQDERFAEIELENYLLLAKLSKILQRSHNPTLGTREWGGGVRLDNHQVPVIDHCVATTTNEFGAAIEPSSLNIGFRQRQQDRIAQENRELVRRLQVARPTYDTSKLEDDARDRRDWLSRRAVHQAHGRLYGGALNSTGGKEYFARGMRPHSAPITSSQLPPAPAPFAGAAGASRPARPQTAYPGRRPESAPQASAYQSEEAEATGAVLELLKAHMGSATTLSEMRELRDSLMESKSPLPPGVTTRVISTAGGVSLEVVRAPGCADDDGVVVMLVHGGMFMTGSARGVRHLAARLSSDLRVPVATPGLRLTPEHRCPAPFDDLSAAYAHVMQHGVGHAAAAAAPPRRVALFAESSGCSLALSLVLQLVEQQAELPSAMAFASPWLDLTCSGGSFIVNQAHDPVLQRDKLVSMASHFLVGRDPADPKFSPLLAPRPLFMRLPPTLIHVGDTEVLLDDARNLEGALKGAGVEVELREYKNVLHAWHNFFPLMPQAEQAVEEIVVFLREKLRLPGMGRTLEPLEEEGGD